MPTWAWWTGGGLLAALGGWLLLTPSSQTAAVESDAETPAAGVIPQPLFMAGGGGTTQSSVQPIDYGRATNQPTGVPAVEDSNVTIAKIAADLQKYQIDAASKLQESAITQATIVPNTPTTSRPELRGNSIKAGADYITSRIISNKTNNAQTEMDIFNKAKEAGYSATEVAASFSAAGHNVSKAQVDDWLKMRGLSL